MENQDKTTFSLDDEEIVEEEVIDRDEEYEDDDYEDEDYGEEEDYDDYEDEDYGEEEDYDDGYNDDYYDDRLNKVLDEIAELKRSMSSQTPAVQMPFAPPPQYVYQPSAPPAGSEVVMYNEISRLRDELAKNQSNLEMQKELSRLKEDMARDQKFAESQYNAEIKRLQDRIEDLLKNGSSPQSELLGPGQSEPARLEGGKSDRNQLDFDKLLSITEAVLRTTKDSDARIRNEIAALKQKVDEFPSNEVLGNALESIKKAASSADAVGADAISRLSNDINALRAAMGDKSAPASVQPSTTVVVNSGSEADVSASELLRQLYEIKNAIGSSSAASVKRTQNLIELIAEYKKVSFDVHSESVPFKDKLSGVIGYSKKLAESNEPDAVELMDATNELIKGLNAQRLNRAVFADLSTFLASNGTPLPVTVRDSAERFFAICERIEAANIDGYSDYLHDLIAERNVLEENRHEKENSELFTQVTDALFAEKRDERTIKELVSRLCNLTVGEITELPLIGEFKAYKPSRSVGDESILNKLAEIKALIEETNAAKPQEEEPKPEPEAEPVTGSFHEQDPGSVEDDFGDDFGVVPESASSSVASQEILDALNELKLAVRAKATVTEGVNDNAAGIDEALQEIRTNYLDVSDKLVGISEMLTAQQNSEAPVDNGADDAQQAIDRQQTLDDLAYIHAKLDEQNEFLAQIPDLRADILNISGTIDFTEQYNALVGEITAQFDKLFEDLSNVIVESEANILNRLGESEGSSEALEQAKADIITETQQAKADIIAEAQSIKDSLFIISDAVTNSAVIDAVEQLRSDLSAFADLTAANVDASTADRQKLLDDIAYLREMADGALSDREQAAFTEDMAAGEQPDLLTVVDEVADRVAQLATVPDELAIVKDNTALILDSVVPLGENVSSAREAALATLDALTPITERVNAILERLDNPAAYEDVSEQGQEEAVPDVLAEDFEQIKENLNTVLDTFPLLPQADDLITARDNTYSILDTLTMMPQAEDVITTRDNVVAVLDAINALTESVNAIVDGQAPSQDNDTLANVLADMGAVLDKLEAFEQRLADDKQEIIDAVGSIREEVHINELEENITAAGIDNETRDALVGEISDIRERLNNIESTTQSLNDATTSVLDGISAQLADLQSAVIAQPAGAAEGGSVTDGMQVILDELSALKEKIDTNAEFDMVEEILSLRDDVKAARIVDQNEVSGELESIKNELASISSGNILDEIRALREEIASIGVGGAVTESAPTNDELNLVLNEIVSLRDEMFAFKDEVLGATPVEEPVGEQAVATETDDVTTILDEITALRADQNALTEDIDELKDIISRRTTVATEGGEDVVADSGALSVVLDEIINLKNELERVEQAAGGDRLDILAEQVEEIRNLVEGLQVSHGEPTEAADGAVYSEATVAADSSVLDKLDEINAAISELRLERASAPEAPVEAIEVESEISELRSEIELLRQENEQLRRENSEAVANGFAELREAIRDLALASQPVAGENGDTSYAALIEEVRSLKEQVASASSERPMSEELNEIRDEIAQLRSLTTVTAEGGSAYEVAAIRSELAELKSAITSPDSLVGLAEDVTSIRADVQTLKEEPDLGVINEILALRDEFQSLREQIEDVKAIAGQTNAQTDDRILGEVQSLRDQLFAISMANVNDSASGESNYESYNNLILDEISMLRDQMGAASSDEDIRALADEVAEVRNAIERRDDRLDELSSRVAELDSGDANVRILDELSGLKEELTNQRDADLATLNFMSEMAQLIERQNAYLSQNDGAKIAAEIESLKSGLAGNDVAEELAKLREIMTQYGKASDNEAVVEELSELREALSAEKPSNENALILQEIARLRVELTAIADREQPRHDVVATSNADESISDADLQDSLSDLKNSLNAIAGIVEPEKKAPAKKTTTKKPSGKKPASTGAKKKPGPKAAATGTTQRKKPGPKPGTKRTTKATAQSTAQVSAPTETPLPPQDEPADVADFDEKVLEELARLDTGDELSLNPQDPISSDVLDVADRLAQQVANKLVLEQLVEQLGDGGVDADHVDELLRDILPNEFTTVAMTEQSDKVRRLANQLVLNKLRERLNGRKPDED